MSGPASNTKGRTTVMNDSRLALRQRATRTGVAGVAALLLITGAAWHGIAADQHATTKLATVTTPITHAIAGGRDSYADIVDVVAPAVVTIRTEGKARMQPTQFEGQDDDFLRRFFGDQFGQGNGMPRMPRMPRGGGKQRALGSGVVVTTDGHGSYEDFLQTDAPINHGNSGGALVSTKGELVGINSQILSESGGNIGIGFAIPVNMAKSVMEQLRTKGKVTRSQLGVTVQNVSSEMASNLGLEQTGGVIVSSVTSGSAADRAGVKQGDVIESFNGQHVTDINTLRNRVAEAGPGATADLVIVRDGADQHVSVKLDEANPGRNVKNARPGGESDSTSDDKAALGVSVAPLTPELAQRLGAPKDASGLVVQDVNPDGRAADAGIQQGDIIQSVNRQPVKTVDDLRSAIKKMSDKPALLLINRQGNNLFVTVKPANG